MRVCVCVFCCGWVWVRMCEYVYVSECVRACVYGWCSAFFPTLILISFSFSNNSVPSFFFFTRVPDPTEPFFLFFFIFFSHFLHPFSTPAHFLSFFLQFIFLSIFSTFFLLPSFLPFLYSISFSLYIFLLLSFFLCLFISPRPPFLFFFYRLFTFPTLSIFSSSYPFLSLLFLLL